MENVEITPEYLEKLLLDDNWRSAIINLVIKNKLDPWNVDIKMLSYHFKKTIENIAEKGFYLPSNVIVAMAVLLKLKAMKLNIEEEIELKEPDINVNVENSIAIKRAKPKLPLSVGDIINYIDRILKKIEREGEKKAFIEESKEYSENFFELNDEDIKNEIERFYNIIKNKRSVKFFDITNKENESIVKHLSYMLFLANEEKIIFEQEKPFSDIEIMCK